MKRSLVPSYPRRGLNYASFQFTHTSVSVSQHLPLLQQVFHSCEGFRFAAQRLERFPFKIQEVLLGRCRRTRHVAATKDIDELAADMGLIFGDISGLDRKSVV